MSADNTQTAQDDQKVLYPRNVRRQAQSNLSREEIRAASVARHAKQQMSHDAHTVFLPVRAHLPSVLRSFFEESKRTGTLENYVRVLRNSMLWAETERGRSDDDILDGVEDELDRVIAIRQARNQASEQSDAATDVSA